MNNVRVEAASIPDRLGTTRYSLDNQKVSVLNHSGSCTGHHAVVTRPPRAIVPNSFRSQEQDATQTSTDYDSRCRRQTGAPAAHFSVML